LRLVRFLDSGAESYGVLDGDRVLRLPLLSRLRGRRLPPGIQGLLGLGVEGVRAAEEIVAHSTESERLEASLDRGEVRLLAPVPSPPKIICLGLNYRDHAKEGGKSIPDEPVIFMKPRTAIVGPEDHVVRPSFVRQLDYEAELAVVVGRRGRHIPPPEAEGYILGYTCFNDISARDIQFRDGQWTRGKSFDTFAPIGPCITTAGQIGDPDSLRIASRVNGEVRQSSSTGNMVFGVREVVHQMSRVMTLEPGDIIATGTPAGVGIYAKPEPRLLSPGDVVEVEVEGIGTLRNRIVEERPESTG